MRCPATCCGYGVRAKETPAKFIVTEDTVKQGVAAKRIGKMLDMVDNTILGVVACGTVAVAIALMFDLGFDVIRKEKHSFTHLLGELMFVLIIMELFRQVVRQIFRLPFSLQPFMTIGVIACIRGMLIVQMKLGTGEIEWVAGTLETLAFALTILLLAASSYLYHKIQKPVS